MVAFSEDELGKPIISWAKENLGSKPKPKIKMKVVIKKFFS